jgi:DNA-binding transcriptional MerR regulator
VTSLTIGEAASRAGVSTRTLRYYEQRGLLQPGPRSGGGARRYREADVARVARIRQLQVLLGDDLDHIGAVLAAEDRLATGDILATDVEINDELRAQVARRRVALEAFSEELEGRARTYERAVRRPGVNAGMPA